MHSLKKRKDFAVFQLYCDVHNMQTQHGLNSFKLIIVRLLACCDMGTLLFKTDLRVHAHIID